MGRYLKYFLAAVIAALATPVLATPIDINGVTLTGPTDIAIPEDGLRHGPYTYTITNDSNTTIFFGNHVASFNRFGGGDFTDFANIQATTVFGCGIFLADGESCPFFSFDLLVPNGSDDTDADFGIETIHFLQDLSFVGGNSTLTLNVTITITDPGFSRAPEPATLALLGIGLAGLGCSRRGRKQ